MMAFNCARTILFLLVSAAAFALGGSSALAAGDSPFPDRGSEFLNIGVRFGWTLDDGEFLYGFEASYSRWGFDDVVHGPVFGVDFWKGGTRLQLGYQATAPFTMSGGLETGPTLFIADSATRFGWHLTGYALAVTVPYGQMTYLGDGIEGELGAMLKFPIAQGRRY